MFINIGERTTLSSTETLETTFITSANENTVQNQATNDGKTVINMFNFMVNWDWVDYFKNKY